MFKKWRKYICAALAVIVAFGIVARPSQILAKVGTETKKVQYMDISVILNGMQIMFIGSNDETIEPVVIDGAVYVPLSPVVRAFGKTSTYDGNNKAMIVRSGAAVDGFSYVLTPGTTRDILTDVTYMDISVWLDGRRLYLTGLDGSLFEPLVLFSTVYAPLSPLVRALGGEASYNPSSRTITIKRANPVTPTPSPTPKPTATPKPAATPAPTQGYDPFATPAPTQNSNGAKYYAVAPDVVDLGWLLGVSWDRDASDDTYYLYRYNLTSILKKNTYDDITAAINTWLNLMKAGGWTSEMDEREDEVWFWQRKSPQRLMGLCVNDTYISIIGYK